MEQYKEKRRREVSIKKEVTIEKIKVRKNKVEFFKIRCRNCEFILGTVYYIYFENANKLAYFQVEMGKFKFKIPIRCLKKYDFIEIVKAYYRVCPKCGKKLGNGERKIRITRRGLDFDLELAIDRDLDMIWRRGRGEWVR